MPDVDTVSAELLQGTPAARRFLRRVAANRAGEYWTGEIDAADGAADIVVFRRTVTARAPGDPDVEVRVPVRLEQRAYLPANVHVSYSSAVRLADALARGGRLSANKFASSSSAAKLFGFVSLSLDAFVEGVTWEIGATTWEFRDGRTVRVLISGPWSHAFFPPVRE